MVIDVQRHLRLTKREDFSRIYRMGKSVANHQFVLYYMKRDQTEQFHLGVSVSKKLGNAVVRNRIRRMIKEVVRLHQDEIEIHMQFIVIARRGAVLLEYGQFEKSLLHLFRKAKMMKKNR